MLMKIQPRNLSRSYSYELLMSAIVPRPIAFVSTIGEDGIFNVAPFSGFSPIGMKPALVSLQIASKRDGSQKDTLKNIEFSKDFVVNVVTEELAIAMNQASAEYPSDVDEFKEIQLTAIKSDLVKAPRVAESPVNMECKLVRMLEFDGNPYGGNIILGEVVLIHLRDELWAENHIDIFKLKAIGRLGGMLYCRLTDIFEIK